MEKFAGLFDYGVTGEGDRALMELIRAIGGGNLNKIKGIIYRDKNGRFCKTEYRPPLTEEELNNLPFIDYSQYLKKLPDGSLTTASVITSRGCRYSCAFCYSPQLWQTYRAQSAARVLDEIEYLTKKYRVRNIRFQDDIFTYNKARCIKIFCGIKEKKLNLNLYMHTRFDLIDEEIIKSFAEAGGEEVFFGLESGSERMRFIIGKGQSPDNKKIIELCKMIKRYKINFGLWIIFGYPGETERDVKITYEFLSKISPREVICNPAQVYPYTQLFAIAQRKGIYKIEDWLGDKKEDFFTYFHGEKLIKAYKNCIFFTNRFSKIKNRQFKSGLFFSI